MSIENTGLVAAQATMLAKMDAHKQALSGVRSNNLSHNSIEFGSVLKSKLDQINAQQVDAAQRVQDYELGLSDDLIGATVASQKASLSFSALMQIRNKFVAGYDELSKMPL
ncbi:flagellar hook-basal body complex protein FliE [Vibrio owensii]|uniref:flagellar hook-basal body complex protein FliE n=1 Tax=Vibrio owensii TaxID=696485 RepID=UPI0018F19DC7|nr:flagellar hook-basal body complex protein FliE [Vibrio owensii]